MANQRFLGFIDLVGTVNKRLQKIFIRRRSVRVEHLLEVDFNAKTALEFVVERIKIPLLFNGIRRDKAAEQIGEIPLTQILDELTAVGRFKNLIA